MKEYRLTVQRTITLLGVVYIEGDSPEDAQTRFQHQLEAEQCPGIEDEDMWGEAFYYGVVKAGPYDSEYDIVDVIEEEGV